MYITDMTEHVRALQHAGTVTPNGVTVAYSHMCCADLCLQTSDVSRLECEFRRVTSPIAAVLAVPYTDRPPKP